MAELICLANVSNVGINGGEKLKLEIERQETYEVLFELDGNQCEFRLIQTRPGKTYVCRLLDAKHNAKECGKNETIVIQVPEDLDESLVSN